MPGETLTVLCATVRATHKPKNFNQGKVCYTYETPESTAVKPSWYEQSLMQSAQLFRGVCSEQVLNVL